MLDDTSHSDWVQILNKSYVRACVVLFVPGLGPETFNIDPTRGSEGRRMRQMDELQSTHLPHVKDIFKYLWLPKAPGTATQLYSPIQAFLNCPLSNSQIQQRAREQSNRKGESIELDSLLMSSAEMRNAGYPMHPFWED